MITVLIGTENEDMQIPGCTENGHLHNEEKDVRRTKPWTWTSSPQNCEKINVCVLALSLWYFFSSYSYVQTIFGSFLTASPTP
jgi:hypothetical protein